MFANIRNRFISVLAPDLPPEPLYLHNSETQSHGSGHSRFGPFSGHRLRLDGQQSMPDKFAYARPPFLQLLTVDELRASADHHVRPIIVPRDINLLPWGTGYAECVNSGKSEWNEDQAAFCKQVLSDPTHRHPDLPYTYYGIFDGHAGYGAALAASHQFHHILHEKLVDCIDLLLPRDDEMQPNTTTNGFPHPSHFYRRVSKDQLIIGALESAFFHMDALMAQDRARYRDAGGCTACVSLFINGKMFVANAGDSRAVLCRRKVETKEKLVPSVASTSTEADTKTNSDNNNRIDGTFPIPFSFDHTPETERHRLLNVARLKPVLCGVHYVAAEYAKRPHEKDLGQRILCRQGTMKGWTYKTITAEDLRMPVVTGEGKRSRLLGTLGVTRGFGDHGLLALNTGTKIKPFLTPHPDVNSLDLSTIVSIPDENNEDGDYGVLVMATDGLWDVSENEAVARTVFQTLAKFPSEKHRYTMAAQELVAKARGKINDSGHWRLADSRAAATVDDISVIVIPVQQYYREHIEWEQNCLKVLQARRDAHAAQQATEAKEIDATEVTAMLVNGAVGINEFVNDDDDEEEEIVVEVNRHQVQAEIEIEPESESENKTNDAESITTTTANAAEQLNATAIATSTTTTAATTAQIETVTTALSDTKITLTDDDLGSNAKPTTTPSPEKSNKSKQQQQPQHQQQQKGNRNRKEKR